jgi:transposase
VHSAATRSLVLRAQSAGFDADRIHRLTGVPPRSQRRIVHEEATSLMSQPDALKKRSPGRPSDLAPAFRQQIDRLLAPEPTMKGAELLRRLRSDHGYQAGKDPVYRYLKHARPQKPAPAPLVRFEGVAGEFAQHDFGSLSVRYSDGSQEKLTFYAGRLKYSRALHVCLVDAEDTEALLRGIEAFARSMGGLPLLNVIDNTKAAVLKRTKDAATGQERIQYNEQFAAFLAEVNVFAEPTAPYSGNQKGCVENLIRFVKEGFLLARRFRNRADLLAQLEEWLTYLNEQRPCDATGVPPAVRLAQERPRLRPLPFGPEGFGLFSSAIVHRDGRVRCHGYEYSTPQGWIGQTITVRLHRHEVVLHHAGQQVHHRRVPDNGRYSLLPEHRAALFVKPRGEIMAKRQILMDLCPEGEAFFTELVHRRPKRWRTHDLPMAWALLEEWGEARTREALCACVRQGAIGGEYLQAFFLGVAA